MLARSGLATSRSRSSVGASPMPDVCVSRCLSVIDSRGAYECDVGQQVDDAIFKPQLSVVDEAHDAEADHRLRDRRDALAAFRVHRLAGLDVRVAEALAEHELVTAHDADADAGDVVLRDDLGALRRECVRPCPRLSDGIGPPWASMPTARRPRGLALARAVDRAARERAGVLAVTQRRARRSR